MVLKSGVFGMRETDPTLPRYGTDVVQGRFWTFKGKAAWWN